MFDNPFPTPCTFVFDIFWMYITSHIIHRKYAAVPCWGSLSRGVALLGRPAEPGIFPPPLSPPWGTGEMRRLIHLILPLGLTCTPYVFPAPLSCLATLLNPDSCLRLMMIPNVGLQLYVRLHIPSLINVIHFPRILPHLHITYISSND